MLPQVAEEVIDHTCRAVGAPFHRLQEANFAIDRRHLTLNFQSDSFQFTKLSPSLVGLHQLRNCALALEAASLLKQNGVRLSRRAVNHGLKNTHWPGRFQILSKKGKPLLILDVGHNAGGVAAFVDSFRLKFPARKAHVIAGFVKRKRHEDMFASLSQIAASFTLVPLKTRRSSEVNELLQSVDWRGIPAGKARNVHTAYERLLKLASADDIIVIIGSHYLVGEFLASGRDKP